jgi:beta-N-acetylhexosaminidase
VAGVSDPSLIRLADSILVPPFPGTTAPRWLLAALEGGLAGVTLFGPNVPPGTDASRSGELTALTASLRAAAGEPVIAIDEEGGDVTRIAQATGSPYPGNAALGAVDDTALTAAVYRAIGTDLAALGINVDLAPCVDVLAVAANPVIGTRSFGPGTDLVSRHAAAAVTGLQSSGVAACAKHFPGHGSTRTDTHDAIATVGGGLAEVRRRGLPPFAAAIAAGCAAVMPGHLRVPGLAGGVPASLSPAAITGLLRGELGFTGVVVSDALEMRAISGSFGIQEGAVRSVAAGTDLLCLGRDTSRDVYLAVRATLAAAVRDGRLPGERLEEAAGRVTALRARLAEARVHAAGIAGSPGRPVPAGRPEPAAPLVAPGHPQPPAGSAHPLRAADGTPVGLAAARRAVRLSGPRPALTEPVIIEIEPHENTAARRAAWGLRPWVPAGSVHRVAAGAGGDRAARALAAAAGRSLVVVVRDAHRDENTRALAGSLLAQRPDAVVVEIGLPLWQPPAGTFRAYLATYGASRASAQAAAELLGLAVPPGVSAG